MGTPLPSAVLSQQSALCLDPNSGQTPSLQAATSRNCICDCRATACLSLFPDWGKKKKSQPLKNLAGKLGASYCCAAVLGVLSRGFLQGANVWLQASVLPCSRWDALRQPQLLGCSKVKLSLQCFKESRAVKLHLRVTNWKAEKKKTRTKPHQTP